MDSPNSALVCNVPLLTALTPNGLGLIGGLLFGLLGILGWGMAFERVLRKRFTLSNLAYAFIEGTVTTSLLLLTAASAGLAHSAAALSPWIAGLGIFAGGLAWSRRIRNTGGATGSASAWLRILGLAVLVLPPVLKLVLEPMAFGDLTAIWTYHAKALTCEPLWNARYIQEKIWSGTHPEYPLFLPLLHAYFFTVTNSFRDDWVKCWQAVSWLAAIFLIFKETCACLSGRTSQVLGIAVVLGISCIFMCIAGEGKIELNSGIFCTLAILSILRGEPNRLPLLLFGLASSKNEGLASAVVFMFLITVWQSRRKESIRTFAVWAIPAFLLIGIAVLLTHSLPSNHEQYPSHITSITAWKMGLPNMPGIVAGCARILLRPRWLFVAFLLPMAFWIWPPSATSAVNRFRGALVFGASWIAP